MQILLVNHYAGSRKHGMEYRPFYLAREWVRMGHEVTIVAASYSHLRTTAPRVREPAMVEEIEGVSYWWLRTPAYRGNGPRRVVNIAAFVGQLYRYEKRLARLLRPDLVIASSTYPLDALPAHRLAARAQARFVFEVHDLWPLTPVELGGMSPHHPWIVLLQSAENFAYRHADRVASILPHADSYMREHGMSANKFAHIPNGIDTEEWRNDLAPLPRSHAGVLTALRQEGRFLVGYAGAHGLANSLDSVIGAAQLLRTRPVTFVLTGQGPEKERLEAMVRKLDLDNVRFLSPVPKACIPALLDSMDGLYIGLRRAPIFRFGVSPNKLMDYMMAGKPVIHAIETTSDLVADTECGISIGPDSPAALADAVGQLMRLRPEERSAMGLRGREYVLEHHDYRVLARQFLKAAVSDDGTTHQTPSALPGSKGRLDTAA